MDLSGSKVQVMGILNVTPDSFSDGGEFANRDTALRHVEQMVAEGVDIIDIGGESTRPGAQAVSAEQELDRVLPVLRAIDERFDVPVSVDTSKALVMREALAADAAMINDVRALQEEGALAACVGSDKPVCLMHMQGQPRTMQENPQYDNVVSDVSAFFAERIAACESAGIARSRLILDPGFGFGKTLDHNVELLARLDQFASFGLPLLAGLSRKSMLGSLLGKDDAVRPVRKRLYGSLAAALVSVQKGATILRVHDVAATVDMLKVWQAIAEKEIRME